MKEGKEKEIDIFHGTHMLHFCNMNMVMEFLGQAIIKHVLKYANTCILVRYKMMIKFHKWESTKSSKMLHCKIKINLISHKTKH